MNKQPFLYYSRLVTHPIMDFNKKILSHQKFPARITRILARFRQLSNIRETSLIYIIGSNRYITGQKCSSVGIKKSTSQRIFAFFERIKPI